MPRFIVAAIASVLAAAFCWRPIAAWWCLDRGDLALIRGERAAAAAWFAHGLAFAPGWRTLLEDHARATLDIDPAGALAQLRRADCGDPCLAEAGDAEIRLGMEQAAVADYLASHAMSRIGDAAERLTAAGRFDEAIALERALAAGLGDGMLTQADRATTSFAIGRIAAKASYLTPARAAEYHATAINAYRHASTLAPYNEAYLLSFAFAQMQWGDRRQARDAFKRLLGLHPHEFAAEWALAHMRDAAAPR